MKGPLDGYRILDLTAFISGPYGSQLLGDLGADVIKVEPPRGDETREKGTSPSQNMGPGFMNLNRNKRSITMNLKDPADREKFYALVDSADVLFHNMRPEAMARLGVSYQDLIKIRGDIIYCQIVGFNSDGPYGGRPAFEDVIQGVSAYTALQGKASGEPAYAAFAMMDTIAGVFAAKSIIAALLHRERTGEGQQIEVPMLETGLAFYMPSNMWDRTYQPDGELGYPRYLTPSRKPFKTKDGYICTVFSGERQFKAFFRAGGRPELIEDPRFATNKARSINSDELWSVVGEIFAGKTTAEWVAVMAEADLPGMPMNQMQDLFTDTHLTEVGFFRDMQHPTEGPVKLLATPIKFSRSPTAIHRMPPRLGEHNEEVLGPLDKGTGDNPA